MEQSWFRMRASVVGAAGFLNGSEFHEFDTSVVRIVEVELPFAVAADLRFFVAAPSVLAKLRFRGVDVGDAESDVVHDAESVMVSVGRDIEHVLDPIGAVGDLHVHPAGFVIFPSAMPVDVEAENVFVEAIFCGAVVDDEPGVDQVKIVWRGQWVARLAKRSTCRLDESNLVPLGIEDREERAYCVIHSLAFAYLYLLRDEISPEFFDVLSGERDFLDEV